MANPQPNDAHLRIAHSITEAIMVRDFTKRQRKILDLILRLSWGCGKKSAIIPLQKDFSVVGVYEVDIKNELEWLEVSKVILRDEKLYSFNKNFDEWQVSRTRPYQPNRLSELLSINLNGKSPKLSETRSIKLVKHEETTSQNTKQTTLNLATPKENIKKVLNKDIYNIPDWIDKNTWDDFIDMRKKIKASPTERAKELLIKDLEKLKNQGFNPNEVINQSIKNGWKGLFPLKGVLGETHKREARQLRDRRTYTRPENV